MVQRSNQRGLRQWCRPLCASKRLTYFSSITGLRVAAISKGLSKGYTKGVIMKFKLGKKNKKVWYSIIPAMALGIGGIVAGASRKKHNGHSAELEKKLRSVTSKMQGDIEGTLSDVNQSLKGDSVRKLEKNIDKAVEDAKHRLDKLASNAKEELHAIEHA